MKKLLSIIMSAVMLAAVATSLPLNAFAKANIGDVIYGLSVYIDGNIEPGKTPSLYEGEGRTQIQLGYSGGCNVLGATLWTKDPQGNSVSSCSADAAYYEVYYRMNVTDADNVLRGFDTSYTNIYVNGVKILNYTGNVSTYESNGYANTGLEVRVKYYRVSYEDGNCIGFYSPSQKIELTAPEVEGKHFVNWAAENGNHQPAEFENVNSKTSLFTVAPAANTLKPVYEDHSWSEGVVAKEATVTEEGVMEYTCAVCNAVRTEAIPKLEQKANTLYAKGKTVKVKKAVVKKKNVAVKRSKAITVKNAKGTVTYKKSKGNKKITVAKNGKITVKKGLKKGTYKIKIKVTAKGNAEYKAGVKTVTVKIVVK